MRPRTLLGTLAATVALAAALPAPAPAEEPLVGVGAHMVCLAPDDAGGIDEVMRRAGSPLQGEGATFVREGLAAGLDPRILVAIAAHETLLETYGPAQRIRNPFGLGPGWAFSTEAAAIARAARTLAAYYVAEGRTTIPEIGAKWAPIGAANDPTGLNRHWSAGVSTYYAALGGDPARPVLGDAQDALPECAGEATGVAAPAADGPPVVTAWGGVAPRAASAAMADGGDPRTGEPAVIAGFVFPLALPEGAPAAYRNSFGEPGPVECYGAGRRCAVRIQTAPRPHVVAAASGTLRVARAAEREQGIGFWIETEDGDRLGYSPLVAYAEGVAAGVRVAAGRPLGVGTGSLTFAWSRDGERVNPYPLLAATRPPAG